MGIIKKVAILKLDKASILDLIKNDHTNVCKMKTIYLFLVLKPWTHTILRSSSYKVGFMCRMNQLRFPTTEYITIMENELIIALMQSF